MEESQSSKDEMLALVVEQAIISCMENVCHLFNNQVKQRKDGYR